MKITINGFKNFNPRSDLKSMPWLRLQNDFYDKEDFFDEDINTCWLFIFLLCQCAQKVSDTINMDEKYLIQKSKMQKNVFYGALNRLLDKGLILLETNESDRIRSNPLLTNEQNEQNGENRTDRTSLFFDEIINIWNDGAPNFNMPKINKLSASRKKKLNEACKIFKSTDDWKKIFNVASTKSFTDKTGNSFTPNWDYIFRNENYIKFFEEYDTIFEIKQSKEDIIADVEASLFKGLM